MVMALALQSKNDAKLTVAVVTEDAGEAYRPFLKNLRDINSFSMTELPRNQALLQLQQDRLEAVIIIPKEFSANLERGQFRNTLEMYTAPSSRAAATVSEPLINAVMMLWMEAYTVEKTGDYLAAEGIDYDASEAQSQREQIAAIWDSGSLIKLEHIVIDAAINAEKDAGAYATFVRWYGLMTLFYFIAGATWVLDVCKKSLQKRIGQTGTGKWKVILTLSAVAVTICLAGYIFGGTACCLITGIPVSKVLKLMVPMLIYLVNLAGVTLLMASLVRSTIGLMFLAPVLTFLNGILSGLFFPLPQWAYVLALLSRGLPGRWLAEALSNPFGSTIQALLCAVIWLAAGIGTSLLVSRD